MEGGEVGPARLAFASEHLAKIVGLAQSLEGRGEALADGRQGRPICVWSVACRTKNDLPAVLDLPGHKLAGQPRGLLRVRENQVLRSPE
jgi:hypothetical protein